MKPLLLLPLAAVVLFASSCRTVMPLDPMTLKLSCKCMPENFPPHDPCPQHVIVEK